jgi:hypothetical protein
MAKHSHFHNFHSEFANIPEVPVQSSLNPVIDWKQLPVPRSQGNADVLGHTGRESCCFLHWPDPTHSRSIYLIRGIAQISEAIRKVEQT